MLFFDGGVALIFLALWVFCIIDVIMTPEYSCRNLPKLAWLFLVIILADIGSIAWLVAGRPWGPGQPVDMPYKGNRGRMPQAKPTRATNPDDDEEFQARLRARAEEQRRRARDAQQRDEPPAEDTPTP
ncbi:MAG TPA: PLD nuclease N-terminal domain-containing protein [Jatrophihabitans sp.]|nr:PLD nuclease N-terminal domain-containing protein [Jatrophihabitans sp.]